MGEMNSKERSKRNWIFGMLLIFFPVSFYLIQMTKMLIKSNTLGVFFTWIIMMCFGSPLFILCNVSYIIFGISILRSQKWAGKYIIYFLPLGFLFTLFFPWLYPHIHPGYNTMMKIYIIVIHGLLFWFFAQLKQERQRQISTG